MYVQMNNYCIISSKINSRCTPPLHAITPAPSNTAWVIAAAPQATLPNHSEATGILISS